MIRADHLTKRFGNLVAVDDVSLQIPRGHIAGFLGPNGAGKTTCMRMLCGVLPPTSGHAMIDGHVMNSSNRAGRRLLGWLPEGAPAREELRVIEYLQYRAGLVGGVTGRRIDAVLDQCGIGDVRRRVIGQLSRGYRQRVALAAAIVHDPPALVLDEPGTGLDPVQQQAFRALLRDLAGDRAILLSTHQLAEASAVCDDLLIIAGGRLRASRAVDTLRGGHCTVEVEARGIDLATCMSGIPVIDTVTLTNSEPPWQRVICAVSDVATAKTAISEAIAAAGGVVRTLSQGQNSLETWVHSVLEGHHA